MPRLTLRDIANLVRYGAETGRRRFSDTPQGKSILSGGKTSQATMKGIATGGASESDIEKMISSDQETAASRMARARSAR